MGSFRVWPGGSLTGLATYWPAWAPAYVGSRWQGDGSARLGSESLLTGLCLLSAPRLGSSPVAAGWSDWPQSDLAERWARIPVRHNAPATRAFARARSPGRPLFRPDIVPAGLVRAALFLQAGLDFAVTVGLPAVAADRAICDSDSISAGWGGRAVAGFPRPGPPRPGGTDSRPTAARLWLSPAADCRSDWSRSDSADCRLWARAAATYSATRAQCRPWSSARPAPRPGRVPVGPLSPFALTRR